MKTYSDTIAYEAVSILRSGGVDKLMLSIQDYFYYKYEDKLAAVLHLLPHSLLFIRLWFRFARTLHPSHYTDADVMKLIQVDPDNIEYHQSGGPKGCGRIVGGNWDLVREPFQNHITYKSMEQKFDHGLDWKETDRFQQNLNRPEHSGRFSNKKDIKNHFERIEKTYKSIEMDGYYSQRTIYKKAPQKAIETNNSTLHPLFNEIAVNIYRDGSMEQTSSGNHRLSIAKLLNLDSIPVLVRTRHAEWQEIREQIRAANSLDEINPEYKKYLSHPDLYDILSDKRIKE